MKKKGKKGKNGTSAGGGNGSGSGSGGDRRALRSDGRSHSSCPAPPVVDLPTQEQILSSSSAALRSL